MNDEMIVGGFIFGTAADADLAREEFARIEYLDANMNYSNTSKVMQLYDKALDTKMFRTPVGWKYMDKLRAILMDSGYVEALCITSLPGSKRITVYLKGYVPSKKRETLISASMLCP